MLITDGAARVLSRFASRFEKLMAERCTICEHDQRDAIDQAIRAGTSMRSTASAFNISRCAVQRHGANHLHAGDVRAEARKARQTALVKIKTSAPAGPVRIESAADVLDEMRWAYGETKALYEMAKAASDGRLMDKAIGQVGTFLEKFAKSFDLYSDNVNVVQVNTMTSKSLTLIAGLSTAELREIIAADESPAGLPDEAA